MKNTKIEIKIQTAAGTKKILWKLFEPNINKAKVAKGAIRPPPILCEVFHIPILSPLSF